jgi:hypothetical protein
VKPLYSSGWAVLQGTGTNTYILPTSGNYFLIGDLRLFTSQTLYVQGNATLWVTGNLSMSGASSIVVAPGASLKLFVGTTAGPTNQVALTQVNVSGNASTFQLYGLPSTASISWSGNANYLGVIYAPAADLALGGGGNNLYDYQGAIAAKSISLNGHFAIHFDENLRRALFR